VDATSYARRIAAGLCGRCGEQAREGLTLCQTCADEQAAQKANLQRARLCVRCKGKTLPGVSYCATCRELMSKTAIAKAADRFAAGLCIHCGEKRDRETTQICTKCAAVQATYKQNRRNRLKADGICVQCGKRPAVPDRTRCFECSSKVNDYGRSHADLQTIRVRSKERREEAKKNGICFKCFKAKAIHGQKQCKNCSEKGKIRSKIKRAEARKARLAAAGIVGREVVVGGEETERERRARVKAEKTAEREAQLAQLPPAAELKAKMDEHDLSVRDLATMHGIPEDAIRKHLATIGVQPSTRNGWQVRNDAKRAKMEAAHDSTV
jgi:hypothetical protein